MAKTNLKAVEKRDTAKNEELNDLQEVIKECGLNGIGFMACGKLQSMGEFLLKGIEAQT